MPGTEMNVIVEKSGRTIDAAIAHHGHRPVAEKVIARFLLLTPKPDAEKCNASR